MLNVTHNHNPLKVNTALWDVSPTFYCDTDNGLCRLYRGHLLLVVWNEDACRYDGFIDDIFVGATEDDTDDDDALRQRAVLIAALLTRVDDYWASAN